MGGCISQNQSSIPTQTSIPEELHFSTNSTTAQSPIKPSSEPNAASIPMSTVSTEASQLFSKHAQLPLEFVLTAAATASDPNKNARLSVAKIDRRLRADCQARLPKQIQLNVHPFSSLEDVD